VCSSGSEASQALFLRSGIHKPPSSLKLSDLHSLHHSDHVKTKENLAGRVEALRTKTSRARDLFIDGDLPRPAYEEKKAALQDEIEAVEQELSKIGNLYDETGRVEHLRNALLSIENPLSGHYCFLVGFGETEYDLMAAEDIMGKGLGYGSEETAARRGVLQTGGDEGESGRNPRDQPGLGWDLC
jgi:hypothetical protein